jgi:short-subunit dehydrogenase
VKCYNLKEKVAIVTGASRGIGEAIATQLSNCGANIILIARNADKLEIVQERITSPVILSAILPWDVILS